MPKYRLQWDYVSSSLGPFSKGQEVELPDDLAAWMMRDSPGCLVEVKERAAQPKADRQEKGKRNRGKP